ncbi:pentatricopeptide repeat-containing protein At2g27800, mitochondrial-like, partial [Asparagus officinalis]
MMRLLLRSHSPKTLTLICPFSTHPRPKKPTKENLNSPPFSNPTSTTPSNPPLSLHPSDLTHLLSAHPAPPPLLPPLQLGPNPPRFKPDPALFHLTIRNWAAARLVPELTPSPPSPSPPSPLLPLFNTIIYFFAESRALSKAIYVYKLMLKSPDPNARPNIVTYNLLFNALLGKGSNSYIHHLYMDTIRSLFRQMIDSGVKPDITALNFVVRGYVNSMHLNDALRVFHQFTLVYGVEPDENTYGYLVHGLCAQGRTKNAMELYGEMRGKRMGLGARAGNSLVSALAMGGEVEESVRVLWEVVKMGKVVEVITCRT